METADLRETSEMRAIRYLVRAKGGKDSHPLIEAQLPAFPGHETVTLFSQQLDTFRLEYFSLLAFASAVTGIPPEKISIFDVGKHIDGTMRPPGTQVEYYGMDARRHLLDAEELLRNVRDYLSIPWKADKRKEQIALIDAVRGHILACICKIEECFEPHRHAKRSRPDGGKEK